VERAGRDETTPSQATLTRVVELAVQIVVSAPGTTRPVTIRLGSAAERCSCRYIDVEGRLILGSDGGPADRSEGCSLGPDFIVLRDPSLLVDKDARRTGEGAERKSQSDQDAVFVSLCARAGCVPVREIGGEVPVCTCSRALDRRIRVAPSGSIRCQTGREFFSSEVGDSPETSGPGRAPPCFDSRGMRDELKYSKMDAGLTVSD